MGHDAGVAEAKIYIVYNSYNGGVSMRSGPPLDSRPVQDSRKGGRSNAECARRVGNGSVGNGGGKMGIPSSPPRLMIACKGDDRSDMEVVEDVYDVDENGYDMEDEAEVRPEEPFLRRPWSRENAARSLERVAVVRNSLRRLYSRLRVTSWNMGKAISGDGRYAGVGCDQSGLWPGIGDAIDGEVDRVSGTGDRQTRAGTRKVFVGGSGLG